MAKNSFVMEVTFKIEVEFLGVIKKKPYEISTGLGRLEISKNCNTISQNFQG